MNIITFKVISTIVSHPPHKSTFTLSILGIRYSPQFINPYCYIQGGPPNYKLLNKPFKVLTTRTGGYPSYNLLLPSYTPVALVITYKLTYSWGPYLV